MRRRPVAQGSDTHDKLPTTRRRPKLETLEPRLVLTSLTLEQAFGSLSGHSGVCNCPVCTGIGLEAIPVEETSASSGLASAPLSSLPQLHSNAAASAKLFLDFDGHFEASWGGYSNVSTPAFDQDSNVTSFSDAELAAIQQIWARVAEDYAPFNIDVTTVDPGNQTNGVTAVIAIGGNYSDWYGSSAGGVAYVGGFSNFSSNVGYVFENALGSNARYVAEASSHEAGHLFGLRHQSQWNGTTLVNTYHPGDANWAPIMGNSYSAARSTWHNGATNVSSTSFQDDVAVISGSSNGFGYKADDFGNTIPFSSNLPVSGTSVNLAGLIGQNTDVDMWEFTTTGGQVSFTLSVAQFGANLDSILELRDASNNVIVSAAPTNSFGASLTTTVSAGTFYLVARGTGAYGNIGQYTIAGTLPAQGTAPEISVSVSGSGIADGGSLAFGNTTIGTSVSRTFTVTNDGNSTLSLTALDANSMPAGFTLTSNLGSTSLAAGASTTFTVRLDASAAGNYSGGIQLLSDDADESPYNNSISGSVVGVPEISLSVSGSGVSDGGSVNFGSTSVGTAVSRTFTVANDGTATLSLTSLNAANMPAGFTLTSNLGSTSLAPGASTTFTVRLDATNAGNYSGEIQLTSDDANESPYNISISGSVDALPEISAFADGSGIGDGVFIDFGDTEVGSAVTRTFTIRNDGGGTLTLTALDANSMPAGFTLTSNLSDLTLANGDTTTFSVRLDATAQGEYSGELQLASNDSNESPFNIFLSGSVTTPPEISAFADGSGIGDGVFIDFGSTTTGSPVTRTFTIRNDGGGTLNLTALDANSMPGFTLTSNLNDLTLSNGDTATFTVRLDADSAGSFSGQIQVLSDDANESPFRINLEGVVVSAPVPEISVSEGGSNLADGGSVSFGTTTVGSAVTRTFTVTNDGNSTLTLTSLNASSMPAGFTLVSNLGSTSLAAGQSTTFSVRLDATAAGSFSGAISLASNDGNEDPFDLNLSGTVSSTSQWTGPKLIDDSGDGWTRTGGWTNILGKGRENDIDRANRGNGSVQSNWTFADLPEGDYWVWISWTGNKNNASNAPFSVYDGTQAVASWRVNQRTLSTGFDADGTSWAYMGAVHISSGQMTVRLSNAGNGYHVADAVRIDRVFDTSAAELASSTMPAAAGHSAAIASLLASSTARGMPAASPASTRPAAPPSSAPTLDHYFAQEDHFAAAGQDAAGSLAAHLGGLHDDDAVDGVLSLWGELEDGPLAAL